MYSKEKAIADLKFQMMVKRAREGRVMSRNGNGSVDYTRGETYVWMYLPTREVIFSQNPRKDYRRSGFTFLGEMFNGKWMNTKHFMTINYNRRDLKPSSGYRHREGYGWAL